MHNNPVGIAPAAIVQSSERDERWDLHVKAAIGFGKRSAHAVALAGAELVKAKMACPHGLWLKTLSKHGLSQRTAHFWMESFARFAQISNVADLNKIADAVGAMAQGAEQEGAARQPGDEPEDHPLLQMIICKDCRRKGAVRDCRKCRAARQAFVGKGGKGRSKREKGGKVRFDWSALAKHLPAVYALPEKLAKAYPEAKKIDEYAEAKRLLTELAEVVKRLREKVQGAAA